MLRYYFQLIIMPLTYFTIIGVFLYAVFYKLSPKFKAMFLRGKMAFLFGWAHFILASYLSIFISLAVRTEPEAVMGYYYFTVFELPLYFLMWGLAIPLIPSLGQSVALFLSSFIVFSILGSLAYAGLGWIIGKILEIIARHKTKEDIFRWLANVILGIIFLIAIINTDRHIRDLQYILNTWDMTPEYIAIDYAIQLISVIYISILVSFACLMSMLKKLQHKYLIRILFLGAFLAVAVIIKDNLCGYTILYREQILTWQHRLLEPAKDFLMFSVTCFAGFIFFIFPKVKEQFK